MPQLPSRISQPALGRLQLRMRAVLRAPGAQHAPGQAAGQCNAGRHSAAPWRATTGSGFVLRRPDEDETPLSSEEIRVAILNGWSA